LQLQNNSALGLEVKHIHALCFKIKNLVELWQGRNQLFISGWGQFSWNFMRWRHRAD